MNTQEQRERLRWKKRPFAELVRLAWPIVVSMLSYSMMTLVDTLFVGRLGSSALAGVGLGGVALFSLICFAFGLLRATKVLIAQAVGAGRAGEVRAHVGAAVLCAIALGVLVAGLGQLLALLLPLLASSAEAGRLASTYLGIRVLGAPLACLAVALREARYGVGDSRSAMGAALGANVVNIGLDALFIWGLGLGVAGAAWASVIAHGVEATLLAVVQGRVGFGLRLARRTHLAELLRLGTPIGLELVLNVAAFAALVSIIARASEVDLAAHQIALQLSHFSFLPAMALGEAACVLAGQAVGSGDERLVRIVARHTLWAAGTYTTLCGLIYLAAGPLLVSAFTTDPAVQLVAVKLLVIAAVFQPLDGAHVAARCVLRGTGDVRFTAFVTIGFAWLVTPPLALWLGHGLSWGAVGGWIGLGIEIGLGAAALWWRLERGGWRRHAAIARERLDGERVPTALQAAAG
jgi:MATE family multidrug resistance protein